MSFGAVDIAVRYDFETSSGLLIGGPTVEWHRITRGDKEEADVVSASTSGELILDRIDLGWLGNPYGSVQVAYVTDRVKEKDGISYSAALTTFSTKGFAPGSQNSLWSRSMFRYYPHIGVERHAAQADSVGSITLGTATLNAELWPWIGKVQLTGSYAASWQVGGADVDRDLDRLSVGANFYFDDQGRLGFGIEYIDSVDPKESFDRVRRTIFGFKVKL